MRIRVGRYELGTRAVDVFAVPGDSGGSFTCDPAGSRIAQISVGLDYKTWWRCLSVLSHEAHELACVELNCRYRPEVDYSEAGDGYRFIMDHNQFSEVIARAANFMAQCVPALMDVYTAASKPAKPPRKKKRK